MKINFLQLSQKSQLPPFPVPPNANQSKKSPADPNSPQTKQPKYNPSNPQTLQQSLHHILQTNPLYNPAPQQILIQTPSPFLPSNPPLTLPKKPQSPQRNIIQIQQNWKIPDNQPSPSTQTLFQKLHHEKIRHIRPATFCEFFELDEEMTEEYGGERGRGLKPHVSEELYGKLKEGRVRGELRSQKRRIEEMKECTFQPRVREKQEYLKHYTPLMRVEGVIRGEQSCCLQGREEERKSVEAKLHTTAYHYSPNKTHRKSTFKPSPQKPKSNVKAKPPPFILSKHLDPSSLSRMTNKLFMNSKTLKISPSTLSRLCEEEFQVMYSFLYSIEKLNLQLSKEQFEVKMTQFYETLTLNQKCVLNYVDRKLPVDWREVRKGREGDGMQ